MSYGTGGEFDRGDRPNNPKAVGSMPPAPPKSNALWWILGILAFLAIGGALLCCGGGYFAYQFSSEMAGGVVKDAVAADPAIVEHIGTIENVGINLTATSNAGGGNKGVFDVSGDKGTGQLEVVMNNTPGGQQVESCVLVLPNGERHDVQVAGQQDVPFDDGSVVPPPADGEALDASPTESAVESETPPDADAATDPSDTQ